jgi:hypothetical protein
MPDSAKSPDTSLLSREATGGSISEGGGTFQTNVTVGAVCRWLADDGFSQLTRESEGDIEARFFVPGLGTALEFIEAKNHAVTPVEFWTEINRFLELDTAHPNIYRHFTLACPSLSESLKPLINGLARIRNPSEFYGKDSSIFAVSYQDFEELVRKQSRTEKEASFLFEKVSVIFDLGGQSQSDHLLAAIKEFLPEYRVLTGIEIEDVYNNLKVFLYTRTNQPFTRIELEEKFREKISARNLPTPRPITFYIGTIEDKPTGVLHFDWAEFDGKEAPMPARWQDKMLAELEQTRAWILHNRTERNIKIIGRMRLPTAFTIGSIFSATEGFELEIVHRSNSFFASNQAYPENEPTPYVWQSNYTDTLGDASSLVVIIEVISSITENVKGYIQQTGSTIPPMLSLVGTAPLNSTPQAAQAVATVKRLVKECLNTSGSKQLELFLACPSWFACLLGYRSSSLPPIQTYQYLASTSQYLPATFILAR